jgi:tetratricopeptide (TPR) repeat protein
MFPVKMMKFVFLIIVLGFILTGCGGVEEQRSKFFNRGKLLFEKGEFEKAQKNFENATELDPKFANGFYMLGMSLVGQGSSSQAIKAFLKTVEIEPNNLNAQLRLSELLYEKGYFRSAEMRVDEILEKESRNYRAKLLKSKILIKNQKVKLADELLQNITADNAPLPEAYLLLAQIRFENKKYFESQKILTKILEKYPDEFLSRLLLAKVYENQGDLKKAEFEYKLLYKKNSKSEALKDAIVKFYIRTGQPAAGEKFLQDLIKRSPEMIKNRMRLVQFYRDTGEEDLMVECLGKAISDLPQYFEPVQLQVQYLIKKNKIESALAVIDRFCDKVPSGPKYLDAQNLKAEILFETGKWKEALLLVVTVLNENPGDLAANTLKGDILKSQKDYAGAVAAYRTVLFEQPGHVPTSFKMAEAQSLNQEFYLAIETYKHVLENDPNHDEARLAIAKLYTRLGKNDSAKKHLLFFLKRNPKNKEAANMLRNISSENG